jgi:zinc/manganese transport system substrate-binding protein
MGVHIKYGLSLFLLLLTRVHAQLNIITSIPDIADIAQEIGGDKVHVFSLAQGSEDIHMVRARSSFLPKINRAHLVLSLGLLAEDRWFTPIVNASRNKRVKKGNPGWIEVYNGLDILEIPDNPAEQDHVGGHKHGNPHYNNGPYTGKYIARNIYDAYLTVDKKNQAYYEKRLNSYLQKLAMMEKRLKEKAAPLKGVHVISYHADLAYFCKFFGMIVTGCLEPKPGIPPNAKHLAKLVADAKRDGVKLVLFHQAQNPRLPEKIANRVGAKLVCFANMVKSRPEINSFIELQEYNLNLMLEALTKADK